jgi:hypothetical protein
MDLQELAKFTDEFRQPDARARFSTLVRPPPTSDGYVSMPYESYGPLGTAFLTALKKGDWLLASPFSAVEWMGSAEGKTFTRDPTAIADATPEQLARVLTALVRQERFSEGTLSAALDSGILVAIVSRAQTLNRRAGR